MIQAVVDIETDSLNATKIHCIVAQHYQTGEIRKWVGEECKQFGEWSKKIDQYIMHNGISFDAPTLNRLTGSKIRPDQVRDTLLESQLYNPVRDKGHSLASWGERLGFSKLDFEEFDFYTPEMLEYCQRDVELTRKLAQQLEKESKVYKVVKRRGAMTGREIAQYCRDIGSEEARLIADRLVDEGLFDAEDGERTRRYTLAR